MSPKFMFSWSLLVLVLASPLMVDGIVTFGNSPTNNKFINAYDREAKFECPLGQYLTGIHSAFNSYYKDRRWNFHCSGFPKPGKTTCVWSGWANNWDRKLNYKCPDDHLISGIHSQHRNRFEDRRTKFKCCKSANMKRTSCWYSNWTNPWKGTMKIQLKSWYELFGGMMSIHHNWTEDRRHKLLICNWKKN